MANKKAKQAKKKQQTASSSNSRSSTPAPSPTGRSINTNELPTANGIDGQNPPSSSSATPEPPILDDTADKASRAEKVKEDGNTAFKAKRYTEAIDLYTKAIDLNPSEPSYLTNRAASYMMLKKFRPALSDCQLASSLQSQSDSTSPTAATTEPRAKTLLRLARCQLALGSTTPALSTLRTVLSLPALSPASNSAAIQLQQKILALEAHLRNFSSARDKKEWAMARLALDKCLQGIEGEGGEVPVEWRVWRVELELARENWDAAAVATNDALRQTPTSPDLLTLRALLLFLTSKLPQSIQHLQSALRLDPGHERAQRLRKRVRDVDRLKEEGNAAFKAGKWDEAVERYGEALERIGEKEEEGKGGQIRATLLSNRATTLLKLNLHDAALTDITTSLLLLPTSFKALRTRARIELHLAKYDAAIADFKSAIEQAAFEGSEADVKALKGELRKAEVELKRSKTKDYYKILGVERDCTEVDVKKAYRRESLKHHPDKGGDEEKFKLVVEANAVLSDARRRERYDMGDSDDEGGGGGGFGGGMGGMTQMDLAELFAQFHEGHSGGGFGGGGGGFAGGGFGGGGGGRTHTHVHGFPF